jgi:hypothetical protein
VLVVITTIELSPARDGQDQENGRVKEAKTEKRSSHTFLRFKPGVHAGKVDAPEGQLPIAHRFTGR